MTSIDPIGSQTINKAAPAPNSQLSQEGFMKMLLTQLKMQSPLNPFDASTMMQQISQLTGLSASQKLVDSVDVLKSSFATSQVLEASQIVGRNVLFATDTIQLKEGQPAAGALMVPKGADALVVTIADSNGKAIRTLKLNAPSDGVFDFTWDGLDDEGKAVGPGFYKMSAVAPIGGDDTKISTASAYKINSVAMDQAAGTVVLNVDGLGGLSMKDVVKIL